MFLIFFSLRGSPYFIQFCIRFSIFLAKFLKQQCLAIFSWFFNFAERYVDFPVKEFFSCPVMFLKYVNTSFLCYIFELHVPICRVFQSSPRTIKKFLSFLIYIDHIFFVPTAFFSLTLTNSQPSHFLILSSSSIFLVIVCFHVSHQSVLVQLICLNVCWAFCEAVCRLRCWHYGMKSGSFFFSEKTMGSEQARGKTGVV